MKPKHELSRSARTALDGYRQTTEVNALAKARMWRSISQGVQARPVVEPRPSAGAGKALAIVVVSILAAAGLVLWLGGVSFGTATSSPAPDAATYDRTTDRPTTMHTRPPPVEAIEPAPMVAPPPPVPPERLEPTTTKRRMDSASKSRRPEPTPEPEPDPLASEMQLLGDARAHLDRGSYSAALARLAEHERRFPSGQLSQERAALRIEALCSSGQRKQGRGEAIRFLAQWPDSHHTQKIQRACELAPR